MRINIGALGGLRSRFIVLGGMITSSALAMSFAACSSTTTSSPGSDAGGGGTDGSSASDSAGGSDTSSTQDTGSRGDAGGDGPVDPDQACYSLSANACGNCCSNNHPAGDMVFSNALDTCICDPAHCATQCATTDCSSAPDAGSSQPGDPCDVCQNALLGDGGACTVAIAAACNASADCKAFEHCNGKCP